MTKFFENIIDEVCNSLNNIGKHIETLVNEFTDKLDESYNNFDFHNLKPKYDIIELETEYNIRIEIPGIDDKSLHTELVDRSICIHMKKERPLDIDPHKIIYTNRSYGMCKLYIIMPENVRETNIMPFYNDGILTIMFEKYKNGIPLRELVNNDELLDDYEDNSDSFEIFIHDEDDSE
jgi:HSP20 family protein